MTCYDVLQRAKTSFKVRRHATTRDDVLRRAAMVRYDVLRRALTRGDVINRIRTHYGVF